VLIHYQRLKNPLTFFIANSATSATLRLKARGQEITNVIQDDFHIFTHCWANACDLLYREIQGHQSTVIW